MRGRIRRRLALAILLTALIPVCAAIWLSRIMVRQSSERFFMPEIGERLTQSLQLYQDLASAVKARMRANARTLAGSPDIAMSLKDGDKLELSRSLDSALARYPELVSLTVLGSDDSTLANADRGYPLDTAREHALHVRESVGGNATLMATFATDRARFEQHEAMGRFVAAYAQLEQRRNPDEWSYVAAFAALLGITIVAAVGVGSFLARGVSTRLLRLVRATEQVGAGDLSLRVEVGDDDEISELARAFNHMLEEVESNRSRIEYLQRLATWQGMARRLAHEIKNPLTPIQLAVQEVHQRYKGPDKAYRQVVNTTLEVVEAEVGTLRRLVSEFSDFARLPKARLEPDDLFEFLSAQRGQQELIGDPEGGIEVRFFVPPGQLAPVRLDRQMFRRVLANLLNNGIQAAGEAEGGARVHVRADPVDGRWLRLHVDDNGPGIPTELRDSIFDPYVTHKVGGSGLGLAIAKKIIVEHGGSISVDTSPLGGARLTVCLPFGSVGALEDEEPVFDLSREVEDNPADVTP
jgi:nitrogen fixation/metabolism regulation signal transduction histidine kinase